jgi:hypothetical protein
MSLTIFAVFLLTTLILFNTVNYSQIFKVFDMALLSSFNIFNFFIISILFLSTFGQKQIDQDDNLCPKLTSILCVKDVLSDILNAAKEINDIAQEIEQYIVNTKFSLSYN